MICDSVYRHFKGQEYRVVAIAHVPKLAWKKFVVYVPAFVPAKKVWWQSCFLAKHSETEEIIFIERIQDEVFATDTDIDKSTQTLAWARPLESFLEILHSGTVEQTTNYARFQLIIGDPIG